MKLPLSWLSDYTDMTGITPDMYDEIVAEMPTIGRIDTRFSKGKTISKLTSSTIQVSMVPFKLSVK